MTTEIESYKSHRTRAHLQGIHMHLARHLHTIIISSNTSHEAHIKSGFTISIPLAQQAAAVKSSRLAPGTSVPHEGKQTSESILL